MLDMIALLETVHQEPNRSCMLSGLYFAELTLSHASNLVNILRTLSLFRTLKSSNSISHAFIVLFCASIALCCVPYTYPSSNITHRICSVDSQVFSSHRCEYILDYLPELRSKRSAGPYSLICCPGSGLILLIPLICPHVAL